MSFVVAIDGPAGSGKGTIAKNVAKQLKFVNIDTGAMYRCVALYSIENQIHITEKDKIIKSLDNIKIELLENENAQVVILNGKDVTKRIREKDVSEIVSPVSSIIEVRKRLVKLQQELAKGKQVIMEGRDIGTVVFPNANIKIYLDADIDVRAQRRYEECLQKGINVSLDEIKENIIKRDENDKNKEYGALKKADDAILVDTSNLSIKQVTDKIINIIKQKGNEEK